MSISAITNTMRIVGGAIGLVITTVILSSATISISINHVAKSSPNPVTFNILFALGLVMTIACVLLAIRMKFLATNVIPLTAKEMI